GRGDGVQPEIQGDEPVSMNCSGFHPSVFGATENLWSEFLAANHDDFKAEFYIPMVANTLVQEKKAAIEILEGGKVRFGVTYPEDKAVVIDMLENLHASGEYPEKLWK